MLRTTMTAAEALTLQSIEDDTEEAPWMTMGDAQVWATTNLYIALRHYGHIHHPDWYVASMVPVLFPRPGRRRKGQLSPDLFMALAEDYPRQSYDLTIEPNPPSFVLEVLSPESVRRDVEEKPLAYGGLGVDEYVLFAPTGELGQPPLQGYRRDTATGEFVRWEVEEDDVGLPCVWSEALGLWIVGRGREVRAHDRAGNWLLTYAEYATEWEREARMREREARMREREAQMRQIAETEREREMRARERAEEALRVAQEALRRLRGELEHHDES